MAKFDCPKRCVYSCAGSYPRVSYHSATHGQWINARVVASKATRRGTAWHVRGENIFEEDSSGRFDRRSRFGGLQGLGKC